MNFGGLLGVGEGLQDLCQVVGCASTVHPATRSRRLLHSGAAGRFAAGRRAVRFASSGERPRLGRAVHSVGERQRSPAPRLGNGSSESNCTPPFRALLHGQKLELNCRAKPRTTVILAQDRCAPTSLSDALQRLCAWCGRPHGRRRATSEALSFATRPGTCPPRCPLRYRQGG
jgi:hypothetical protein